MTSSDGGSELWQCKGCLEAHQRSWFYLHFRRCEKVQVLLREAEEKYTPHHSSVKRRRLASTSTADASMQGPVGASSCPDFGDAFGDAGSSEEYPDMSARLEAFRIVTNEETGHQEAITSDEAGSEADLEQCISDMVSSHATAEALAAHMCVGLPWCCVSVCADVRQRSQILEFHLQHPIFAGIRRRTIRVRLRGSWA